MCTHWCPAPATHRLFNSLRSSGTMPELERGLRITETISKHMTFKFQSCVLWWLVKIILWHRLSGKIYILPSKPTFDYAGLVYVVKRCTRKAEYTVHVRYGTKVRPPPYKEGGHNVLPQSVCIQDTHSSCHAVYYNRTAVSCHIIDILYRLACPDPATDSSDRRNQTLSDIFRVLHHSVFSSSQIQTNITKQI